MYITEEDVGREVILRDGERTKIVKWDCNTELGGCRWPVLLATHDGARRESGGAAYGDNDPADIIAFANEFDAAAWEKLNDDGKARIARPVGTSGETCDSDTTAARRDRNATAVLTAILSNPTFDHLSFDEAARDAYGYADAMEKARTELVPIDAP